MTNLMAILQRLLDGMDAGKLSMILSQAAVGGYRLGLDAAVQDLGWKEKLEPDVETIAAIGMRTHALSESTISRAKGNLAFEADKLYQEMNAAMKAGVSEREALTQIQSRFKGLFETSFKDWELERLVRDQLLVGTKEGRRAGWQTGGAKYRQWVMHRDGKTAEDSKRMNGQIVGIDEPYVDPKTGQKYMLPHMRPNDRCWEKPLWELPESIEEKDGLTYAKGLALLTEAKWSSLGTISKGGVGSGIRGHTTLRHYEDLPESITNILHSYEFMERMNSFQLEEFRKHLFTRVLKATEAYHEHVKRFQRYLESFTPEELKGQNIERRLIDHENLIVTLVKGGKALESAFSDDEKKIAIDYVMHIAHTTGGQGAIFRDMMDSLDEEDAVTEAIETLSEEKHMDSLRAQLERTAEREQELKEEMVGNRKRQKELEDKVKTALDFIRDQRIHKGGPGSGIKGHTTERIPKHHEGLPFGIRDILGKYEFMEEMNSAQLEKFRAQMETRIARATETYRAYYDWMKFRVKFDKEHGAPEGSTDKMEIAIETHKQLIKTLDSIHIKLLSAFEDSEIKMAVDAAMSLEHTRDSGAIFRDMMMGEEQSLVTRALDYIRDQRVHKMVDFEKAWTDAARKKALEARRAKMKPKDWEEVKNFKKSLEGLDLNQIEAAALEVRKSNLVVGGAIQAWYGDAGMGKLEAHVTHLFGLSEDGLQRGNKTHYEEGKKSIDRHSMTSLLKLYSCTQAYLNKEYPDSDTVTVYRGVNGHTWEKFRDKRVGEKVNFETANLSSWSLDLDTANGFVFTNGGVIFKMEVPKKHVMLHWKTGGSSHGLEHEMTVLGPRHSVTMFDIKDPGVTQSRHDAGVNTEEESRELGAKRDAEEAAKKLEEAELKTKQLAEIYENFVLRQDTKDLISFALISDAPYKEEYWQTYLRSLDFAIENSKDSRDKEELMERKRQSQKANIPPYKKALIIKMVATVHHGEPDKPFVLFPTEDPYELQHAISAAFNLSRGDLFD